MDASILGKRGCLICNWVPYLPLHLVTANELDLMYVLIRGGVQSQSVTDTIIVVNSKTGTEKEINNGAKTR